MKYLRLVCVISSIVAASFLSGCASTQHLPEYDLQRSDLQQWFANAKSHVESERRMDLDHVTLSAVSSREMLFVLSSLYGQKLDPHMTADTRVRVFAEKAFEDVKYIQAVYDPFAKRIVINQENMQRFIGILNKQSVTARNAAMTILVHELIHAADDEEFDLLAIEKRHKGDTLGVYMVAEGHAEMQTESICHKIGCNKAFRTAQIVFHGADPRDTDQSLLTSTHNNSALVYLQSRKFLKALSERDLSGGLVRQAMITPPGDILEFFDPGNFPDRSRAKRRERVYEVLDAVQLSSNGNPLLKIPEPVYDELNLPSEPTDRMKYVRDQKEKILASGSMNYLDQFDHDLDNVHVQIFEAVSPTAAYEKQQELIKQRKDTTRYLKNYGADVSHPKRAELAEMSTGIPAKTQRYVVQLKERDSGETFRLISSLLIEGRFLIVVNNADDNDINKTALIKTLQQIRRL